MANWLEAIGESVRTALSDDVSILPPSEPNSLSRSPIGTSSFSVPRGQFTFDVEGIEDPGSRFHSRTAHVPSHSSGVTIGRGFDLGTQSPEIISSFLSRAGFESSYVSTAVTAAGLRGDRARDFLEENPLAEINPVQQRKLFELTYEYLERDAQRISSKPDVVGRYGETDWQNLSLSIREMVVDLRYRGDYTPKTRERLQQAIASNNEIDFISAMTDRAYWVDEIGVPEGRYQARVDYLSR